MIHRESIQKMIQFAAKTKPFEAMLEKVRVISAGNGKLEAEMKVEEKHTNFFGTLHGGCTATLVDCLSGYALITHPKLVDKITSLPRTGASGVSVNMHLTFLRGARVGDDILIKADTTKIGKTLAFSKVILLNKQTGDVLATGIHTKFLELGKSDYFRIIDNRFIDEKNNLSLD